MPRTKGSNAVLSILVRNANSRHPNLCRNIVFIPSGNMIKKEKCEGEGTLRERGSSWILSSLESTCIGTKLIVSFIRKPKK